MNTDHEIMSHLGGMVAEEECDEAREAARELLDRLVLVLTTTQGDERAKVVRYGWETKYPWLKLEKWP